MRTTAPCLLVLCTCPDRDTGLRLARLLVDGRLAACVNVLDGVTSVYRWKNAVEEDAETLLLAKTTDARYRELEQALRAHHPYEVPEIIALSVVRGLPDYLAWLTEEGDASNAGPARSS